MIKSSQENFRNISENFHSSENCVVRIVLMVLSCLILKQLNICDALRDLVPLAQFKKRENTHGDVLLLVKLQVSFKLYKWYQIVQSASYSSSCNIFSENDRKTSVNAEQFFSVKHFILKFESLTKRYGNVESPIKFRAVFPVFS